MHPSLHPHHLVSLKLSIYCRHLHAWRTVPPVTSSTLVKSGVEATPARPCGPSLPRPDHQRPAALGVQCRSVRRRRIDFQRREQRRRRYVELICSLPAGGLGLAAHTAALVHCARISTLTAVDDALPMPRLYNAKHTALC